MPACIAGAAGRWPIWTATGGWISRWSTGAARWRNVTPATGHWIGIELRQEGVNTRAVGAWIEVNTGARTILREVTVGGGHAGGTALPEHFGLGEAGRLRVRVTWPDGVQGAWQEVGPDRVTTITRP